MISSFGDFRYICKLSELMGMIECSASKRSASILYSSCLSDVNHLPYGVEAATAKHWSV
jgi:hypothetical protein